MLFRAGQTETLAEGEGQIGYFYCITASEGHEELLLNYTPLPGTF